MQQLPLFVFGTLRRGEVNHGCLAGTYERCLPATLRGFRRSVAAHGFPTILPATGEQVEGELFFIRPEVYDRALRRCDELEDLPPGELAGDYYRREQVTVETAEGKFTAWVYRDAGTPIRTHLQ